MLRTNLASRPFYDERKVRLGIGVLAALAVGLSLFNAIEILTLNGRNSEFAARAAQAEAKARDLHNQAQSIRQALDREDVDAVQAAAREANQLIDRRAFSWTDLFNRFEETLPPDVRIVAVAPQIDNEGRMLVAVTVISRRVEDLDQFIDRLENTGAFSGVISRQEETQEDGTLKSVLQGYYTQRLLLGAGASGRGSGAETVSSPPASDSNGAARNESAANAAPRAPSAGGPR